MTQGLWNSVIDSQTQRRVIESHAICVALWIAAAKLLR